MSESKDTAEQEVDIVLYSVEEGVAWITMNRPQYNNAQNGRMTYELDDAFKRAVADDEVKVIVLRGEGKHFSAGHDVMMASFTFGVNSVSGIPITELVS